MNRTRLMRDKVKLIKKDGREFEDIQASVSVEKIITYRVEIPVEEGDFYQRVLPNSVIETYEILNSGYSAGIGSIAPNYQSRVRKVTEIPRRKPDTVTNYHFSGDNSRVNIDSTDNSINISVISPETLLDELANLVSREVKDTHQLTEIQIAINEMRNAKDKPTFSRAYGNFMASAADHMGVFQPLATGLILLLTSLPG